MSKNQEEVMKNTPQSYIDRMKPIIDIMATSSRDYNLPKHDNDGWEHKYYISAFDKESIIGICRHIYSKGFVGKISINKYTVLLDSMTTENRLTYAYFVEDDIKRFYFKIGYIIPEDNTVEEIIEKIERS